MKYFYVISGLGESPGDFSTIEAKDWFDDCKARTFGFLKHHQMNLKKHKSKRHWPEHH